MNDGGVIGGACAVEGIFVELLVVFVGIFMDSEAGFIGKVLELAALGFELMEVVGVPEQSE